MLVINCLCNKLIRYLIKLLKLMKLMIRSNASVKNLSIIWFSYVLNQAFIVHKMQLFLFDLEVRACSYVLYVCNRMQRVQNKMSIKPVLQIFSLNKIIVGLSIMLQKQILQLNLWQRFVRRRKKTFFKPPIFYIKSKSNKSYKFLIDA